MVERKNNKNKEMKLRAICFFNSSVVTKVLIDRNDVVVRCRGRPAVIYEKSAKIVKDIMGGMSDAGGVGGGGESRHVCEAGWGSLLRC